MKTTLVLGASHKPGRYANLALHRLQEEGHTVYALGRQKGMVAGVDIETNLALLQLPDELDTVTLYLNPQNQLEYQDWLLALAPKRVIFNPGTENPAFAQQLSEKEIEPVFACTLVMLATGQY